MTREQKLEGTAAELYNALYALWQLGLEYSDAMPDEYRQSAHQRFANARVAMQNASGRVDPPVRIYALP